MQARWLAIESSFGEADIPLVTFLDCMHHPLPVNILIILFLKAVARRK